MKTKILFVCPSFSTFIQNDLDILRRHFDVKVAHYQGKNGIPKFLIETLKGVLWSNVTFSWFADVHAFAAVLFSKIFRIKSIVVVGGYEVAKVPEIDYGGMLSRRKAFIVKFVLKHADKVLAVSEFSKSEILKYVKSQKVELIHNSIECDKFNSIEKKEDFVITVSIGNTLDRVYLKGLNTFVKTAVFLPEIKFIVIGILGDALKELRKIANSNVEFISPLPRDKLILYYQRAKVYCQLSMYESFGMTLAEAMSCECVPVITNNAALPEVVGDTGFYVPYGDPKATVEAVKDALKYDKGKKARERIKNMFPIERREYKLVKIIRGLLSGEK